MKNIRLKNSRCWMAGPSGMPCQLLGEQEHISLCRVGEVGRAHGAVKSQNVGDDALFGGRTHAQAQAAVISPARLARANGIHMQAEHHMC